MYMCPIPNGFRDTAMEVTTRTEERLDALRRSVRCVLTGPAKCTDSEGGILENELF
jgi:hypothetical protein